MIQRESSDSFMSQFGTSVVTNVVLELEQINLPELIMATEDHDDHCLSCLPSSSNS